MSKKRTYEEVMKVLRPPRPIGMTQGVIKCPHCGEPFPITLRIIGVDFALDYPMSKEEREEALKRRLPS